MRNTKCKNDNDQLKIILYYKNKKTANLLIKNNPTSQVDTLNMNNVIYKYTCSLMTCQSEYISMTRTTLKKRLDSHYYYGNIQTHHNLYHKEKLTKENYRKTPSQLKKKITIRN